MPAFGRVLTAMASPMHQDGSLDLDGAQQLAVHLVEHGCDGIVVAGTTGESPTLTHGETLDLVRAVVEAVGERARVIAGAGKNDTAAAVEMTREVASLGVDGTLHVTGYYNRPSQRGLETHFRAVAGATDLPVMLYDIPSRTANEIEARTLVSLATEIDTIVAVKDAASNMAKSSWVAANKPDDFDIYAGNDIDLLPLLAIGAVGVVSVAGHLVGSDLAHLIDSFPTDPAKAREIHHRLVDLFKALFVDASPGPLKAALDMVGLPGGPVRPPLADADDEVVAIVRDALAGVGLSPRPGTRAV